MFCFDFFFLFFFLSQGSVEKYIGVIDLAV